MTPLLDRLRAVESPSVVPAGLSRPSVEAVVYAVTAALLLVGPATTAAGATWIVLSLLGPSFAVVTAGVAATGYGLFLIGLLDRAGYLS